MINKMLFYQVYLTSAGYFQWSYIDNNIVYYRTSDIIYPCYFLYRLWNYW